MKIVNEYEKGTPFSFLGLHMAQNLDKLKSWEAASKMENQLALEYLIILWC